MRKPIKLDFGEQSFEIKPLTLMQVEALEELFTPGGEAAKFSNTRKAREAIKIALSRHHAAVDVAELEVDVQTLPMQLNAILHLGGFATNHTVGEASAAAGTHARDGETSEGGSQLRDGAHH